MEIKDGIYYNKGHELNPSIISKARYALGIKKEKPVNQRTCTPAYWVELVTIFGKHYKVGKEKIEKAKRSRIYK